MFNSSEQGNKTQNGEIKKERKLKETELLQLGLLTNVM
jgi:hypothetical protein